MVKTLAQRLLLLIAVAIGGSLFAALGGMYTTHKTTLAAADLHHTIIPSIEAIDLAHSRFLRVRTSTMTALLVAGESERREARERATAFRQEVTDALNRYEKELLDSDEDLKFLNEDRKALSAYMSSLDKLWAKYDASGPDEAKLTLPELHALAQEVQTAFEKHIEYNHKSEAVSVAEMESIESKGRNFQIVLSLCAMAVLLWTARIAWSRIVDETRRASTEISRVTRERDFTHTIQVTGDDEIAAMLKAFNALVAELQDSFKAMHGQARELQSHAQALSQTANELASSAGSQSQASSAMASTVEEMTTSVSHVADQTSDASQLTQDAQLAAQEGLAAINGSVSTVEDVARIVEETAAMMRTLDENGHQIGVVVGVIKDVADQTNLLALNAAIEAARAGEQGRGFAVVADEVRKLAERTSSSTGEISRMVSMIQQGAAAVSQRMVGAVDSVRSGVEKGGESRDLVARIADSTRSSTAIANDIASAMKEQRIASEQIAKRVEQVAQMAEVNNHVATQTHDLAMKLNEASLAMSKMLEVYRV
ncbi:methyl-accepting chemotaxis protein [Burkholderiaceae bacterium DAT-1]|nr:methyl-accepting chemotaxis protein [Burkholderiaceae bacterium DAT-1]